MAVPAFSWAAGIHTSQCFTLTNTLSAESEIPTGNTLVIKRTPASFIRALSRAHFIVCLCTHSIITDVNIKQFLVIKSTMSAARIIS